MVTWDTVAVQVFDSNTCVIKWSKRVMLAEIWIGSIT